MLNLQVTHSLCMDPALRIRQLNVTARCLRHYWSFTARHRVDIAIIPQGRKKTTHANGTREVNYFASAFIATFLLRRLTALASTECCCRKAGVWSRESASPFWERERPRLQAHHILLLAGCNPWWSEFSTYKNCYIWFSCFCSFWTYVLELSTLIPEIIILATWTIPETTEDDCHGAAVVTLLQDLARR